MTLTTTFCIFSGFYFITCYFLLSSRHVSENDKTGKRYRGVNLDIFSIDDPDGMCYMGYLFDGSMDRNWKLL